MCAMALSYSCHCHALLSAYELSARAAGATACMRVRVCHMVHWGLRDCPYTYLRVTVCAIHAIITLNYGGLQKRTGFNFLAYTESNSTRRIKLRVR